MTTAETVKLVYVGIHEEVFLPALDDLIAVRGVPVEVPADVADQLLEQVGNWAKPNTKAAKNAPAAHDTPLTDEIAAQAL